VARRLRHDIPGPDRRVGLDELRARGAGAVFAPDLGSDAPLVVELGFGRGEFLMELAAREPETAHLGVEVSHKRVLKMARRLARTELGNVRLVEARAEAVVGECLAPASVRAFWVNFPDPWPKKRHQRRRLLQPPLVHALARCLAPGGELHAATDHVAYAEAIDAVLRAEPLLENAVAPAPWLREVPGRKPTAYELEWRAEGRALHFFEYRRSREGTSS
jgi:tRNA (guanine-N7-)-methyltransferase